MIGFQNGERIYSEVISHYQDAFKLFVQTLQPSDTDYAVVLTGPRKLAQNFIYEDPTPDYIYVVANSKERYCAELREQMTGREGVLVKLESELTESDLMRHLMLEGSTASYGFDFLQDQDTPIRFGYGQVRVGDYRFAAADVGLVAVFPNPHNRQSYVWMRLISQHGGRLLNNNGNDFTIWRYGDKEEPCQKLVDGNFAKHAGNAWTFADSLALTYANLASFCKGGVCPLPTSAFQEAIAHEYRPAVRGWKSVPSGSLMVLGHGNCRLPSIAAGPDGEIAVCWEENGDIVMATMQVDGEPVVITIESGSHDSFDPQIAWNGDSYFVAYLSNQDGWFRLFGHFVSDDRVSPQVLVSERGTLDVLTPAVVADTTGQLTIAWTEWKANQRFPFYRVFEGRTAGPIQTLQHLSEGTDDYTNVWYFDLALDHDGNVFGAWNQHYPATLGVCSGNLVNQASSVTRVAEDQQNHENGGYPSLAFAPDGRRWVAWETCWWDAHDRPQQILATYYDSNLDSWAVPFELTKGRQCLLNQSPQIVSQAGGLTAVWSGRADHSDSTWGIYLSNFDGKKWGDPVLVSPEGVCARAPQITIASESAIWITWHSGIGSEMRTAVLRYHPDIVDP